MTSWLRREADSHLAKEDGPLGSANALLEDFGRHVLAEVERQVTIEQTHVDGLSDPAWNAYESALTIIRSLREGQ